METEQEDSNINTIPSTHVESVEPIQSNKKTTNIPIEDIYTDEHFKLNAVERSATCSSVYKLYLLDAHGKPTAIYVFTGNSGPISNDAVFSDTELVEIETNKTEIIYSKQQIHKDDSIRIIKKKCIKEIGENKIAYDEIYLFSTYPDKINLLSFYERVTANYQRQFTYETLCQLLYNLNLETVISTFIKKPNYEYDEIAFLNGFVNLSIPIGQKFTKYNDFLFSANPYSILNDTYVPSTENALITYENQLLLNYNNITNNIIYLCTAPNVFDYAVQHNIPEETIAQLYFPFLAQQGITTKDAFLNIQSNLIKENAKILKSQSFKLYSIIDMFYDMYHSKTTEIPYIEQGIKSFHLILHPEYNAILPLDAIFKNIHATLRIPFIKYNPGIRRENIYRLYSEKVSVSGKKIPYLSKATIMNLSKQIGKSRQISVFVQGSSANDIFIDFDYNGNIHVRADLKATTTKGEIESMLGETVNSVVDDLNVFLEQTGYVIQKFTSLDDRLVEVVDMKFVSTINMENKIIMKNYIGCLTAIFNIIDDNMAKGANLIFKRVNNYKKMDSISMEISKAFRNAYSRIEIIGNLMQNHNLSKDEAIAHIASFLNEHTITQGEFVNKSIDIIDNPGFPTVFKILPFSNTFTIEIQNINHINYIPILNMYVDSFLRMTQQPNSSVVDVSKIKQYCSRLSNIMDESHIENVVLPQAVKPLVKPMLIITENEELDEGIVFHEDDDLDQGIVFDVEDEDEEDDEGIVFEDEDEDEDDEPEEEDDEGIVFDVEDEDQDDEDENDDEGIVFDEDENEDEQDDKEKLTGGEDELLDNAPFKKNKLFFDKMKKNEPTLFLTKSEGKYDSYSRICPTNVNLQPILLTKVEKDKIDKEHPDSYGKALEYGTDPNNPFYYICPRFWCLKTKSSMTEEEVKSGKCGKIIPKDATVIPEGAYVYEFTDDKYHKDNKGNYRQHYPGFKDSKSHPQGYCLPCCFNNWNAPQQVERREQCMKTDASVKITEPTKAQNTQYVVGIDKYPIPQYRWGFLPPSIEMFLGSDHLKAVTKNNYAIIKQNIPVFLRYGVEQSSKHSFLGCLVDIYAHQHGSKKQQNPTVKEFQNILRDAISLDLFLQYHNGSLAAIFQPKRIEETEYYIDTKTQQQCKIDEIVRQKYASTVFYKSIDLRIPAQCDFLNDTIASYENFLKFIQDENSIIDHTYLWDVVCFANPKLFKNGLNLVILRILNNDVTDNVELLCPSNSYSKQLYDPKKETLILLKHDEFYEPIYLYENKTNGIHSIKTFSSKQSNIKNIQYVLQTIQKTTNEKCAPLPSMPYRYHFKTNVVAATLHEDVKSIDYIVVSQIMNYQGKIIGLLVKPTVETKDAILVPCFPSHILQSVKIQYMENKTYSTDYVTTRDALLEINALSQGKILCKPLIKVIDAELIVGILTETNQFVQIQPPHENIFDDGLNVLRSADYLIADKTLNRVSRGDIQRIQTVKKIALESNFYLAFRSTIRVLLNQYENRIDREKIIRFIHHSHYLYKEKLQKIETILRNISKEHFMFVDYDDDLIVKNVKADATDSKDLNLSLYSLNEISACMSRCETKNYCVKEDGKCKLLLPKWHLMSGVNNDKIYFGRLADELLRYKRIHAFMIEPKTFLNITNIDYSIRDDEFIMLQSLLTNEYFDDLVPFQSNDYAKHINYDSAKPVTSHIYQNIVK